MATSAVIGIEITDATGRAAAGLKTELAPATVSPKSAANALSAYLAGMAAGVYPGALRVRVDTGTDYAATESFTVTGANIAAAEYIAFRYRGVMYKITAVASGAVSGDGTFDVSATDNTVATNIRACINSYPGLKDIVTASGSTNTVTLTANVAGLQGNTIELFDGTTNGLTGMASTLTGGLDAGSRVTSAVAITHANVSADDTFSIGSVTLTWKVSASGEDQVTIGASATADGDNLAAKINAHSKLAGLVSAVNASGTVTMTWLVDPRIAMLMLLATSDATAMALTQPSLGSRTYATEQAVRLYTLGAAT
jgi:hypothetical protein